MNELDALWAFLVAAVVALALTPLAMRFAWRFGVVHEPRDRDLSERPTPLLGGLAILAAVLVAGVLFLPGGGETRGILAGAAAIALIGALDDKYDLHPLVKLTGQLAAALVAVLSVVRVENVTVPFGSFSGCIRTDDRNPLESGSTESKFYCPDVGTVLEFPVGSPSERTELVDFVGP